ncbi:acyltransferase [Acidocella sp.]|uniref:acyltransferase family protein n=1 Tax=Acidocella sp. TaxID=50710 RepID=UPI0026354952|nr:acyltransferase [Acidocella sp.]
MMRPHSLAMNQIRRDAPSPPPLSGARREGIAPAKEEIDALTGLRGVAAVLVAIYHIYPPADFPWGLRQIIARSYLSVDVFFVLSGFVMALNYGGMFRNGFRREAFLTFMLRRLARLYPLYIVFLALRVGYSLIAYGSLQVPGCWFAVDLPHPALSLLANAAMVQSWGIATAITNPTWSVSVEWGVYFLFPWLALATLHGRPWHAWLACAMAAALIALVGWLTAHDGGWHNGVLDAYDGRTPSPMLRCLGGFILGLALYRLYGWGPARRLAAAGWGWLVAAYLLAGVLLQWSDYALYAGFPLLILALACDRGWLGRLLAWGPVFQAGVLSYAIYVIHNPWIGLFQWSRRVLPGHMPGWLAETVIALGLAGSILGAAMLLHRLVEVPGRRWVRRLAPFRAAQPRS